MEETTTVFGGFQSARVRLEAVFEIETNLPAIAQVFRALQAEAGTRVLTRTHGEGIVRIATRRLNLRPVEARIDHAIKRNFGSHRGAGQRTENGDCSKSLFHLRDLQNKFRKLLKAFAGTRPHFQPPSLFMRRPHSSIRLRNSPTLRQ